jgi:aminoglycoside phosphotransferase (APT) family kinase protein
MGDFWPGNLMVKTDVEGSLERIYVLDWELAKTGPTGMDIGQFASEIHLLRRCNPETCKDTAPTLLEHFFKEYKAVRPPSVGDVRGAIVHWGTHATICGARVDWGGKEITQEVVREGVRLLVDGWSGDEAWLRKSLIGSLL